jgi:hypothetical protein
MMNGTGQYCRFYIRDYIRDETVDFVVHANGVLGAGQKDPEISYSLTKVLMRFLAGSLPKTTPPTRLKNAEEIP